MSLRLQPYLVRTTSLAALIAAAVVFVPILAPAILPSTDAPPGPDLTACSPRDVPGASPTAVAQHVVLISVDGLRPDAIDALGEAGAPTLHRFRREGATTDNARTDYAATVTLPNHASQLTGRSVGGDCGHNWSENGAPAPGRTLHTNKSAYVASVFDIAHDHGLRTVAFASKAKFALFEASYDEANGAPDTTGPDDGRDKIDRFVHDADTEALTATFVEELRATRFGFGFLHLRDPDSKGHSFGWDLGAGSPYMEAVRKVDRLVGDVLEAIASDPVLNGATAVILTADHGGVSGRFRLGRSLPSRFLPGRFRPGHGNARAASAYTIPFYVWGAGVEAGGDLYALNAATRRDPGRGRPSYKAASQPIRNGDAANLALGLLGLRAVPGSTLNPAVGPLAVSGEGGAGLGGAYVEAVR